MTHERLQTLLPQYIPDSCLAGSGMKEKWMAMVRKAFVEVSNQQKLIIMSASIGRVVILSLEKLTIKFFFVISGSICQEQD